MYLISQNENQYYMYQQRLLLKKQKQKKKHSLKFYKSALLMSNGIDFNKSLLLTCNFRYS